MRKSKIILLIGFILIFLLSTNSFGQRIKYKDCKNNYSTKNYRIRIEDPKYSPLVAGVSNCLIPSAGYFYIGEPLRGACVFGGELITGSVFMYGLIMALTVNSETGQSPNGAKTVMLSGLIATGLIQIWSVYDVVRIAKIKNLAYQEKRLTARLQPDLSLGNVNDKRTAIYGLRLTIDF